MPWRELKIDVVLESTGRFTSREGAEKHLAPELEKVILTAPGKGHGRHFRTRSERWDLDPRTHNIIFKRFVAPPKLPCSDRSTATRQVS